MPLSLSIANFGPKEKALRTPDLKSTLGLEFVVGERKEAEIKVYDAPGVPSDTSGLIPRLGLGVPGGAPVVLAEDFAPIAGGWTCTLNFGTEGLGALLANRTEKELSLELDVTNPITEARKTLVYTPLEVKKGVLGDNPTIPAPTILYAPLSLYADLADRVETIESEYITADDIPVTSVAGKTGAVSLAIGDVNVNLGNILAGRGNSGAGGLTAIFLNDGLEWFGTSIRRSAITGDVSIPAGSNVATIAAATPTTPGLVKKGGSDPDSVPTIEQLNLLTSSRFISIDAPLTLLDSDLPYQDIDSDADYDITLPEEPNPAGFFTIYNFGEIYTLTIKNDLGDTLIVLPPLLAATVKRIGGDGNTWRLLG